MNLIQILILAIVQGLAELLPVSSSAHVIAAEKLMGLDPTAPPMTLLLVMLHTGTMFAVIVYFWHAFAPSLVGMVFSFIAGLFALRWLTRWLEQGRWHFFGAYCLLAALAFLWIG